MVGFYSLVDFIIRVNLVATKSKTPTQLAKSINKLEKSLSKLNILLIRNNALSNSVIRILNEIALKLDDIEITD